MKVGGHQGSVLLLLVFAIVVDVVTESVRNSLMSEMYMHVDDLVVMSEMIEGLRERVLEMEGGIREQGAEGEPQRDKSGTSEWSRR